MHLFMRQKNAWNSVNSVQKVLLFNRAITHVQVSHFDAYNWEITLHKIFVEDAECPGWKLFKVKAFT